MVWFESDEIILSLPAEKFEVVGRNDKNIIMKKKKKQKQSAVLHILLTQPLCWMFVFKWTYEEGRWVLILFLDDFFLFSRLFRRISWVVLEWKWLLKVLRVMEIGLPSDNLLLP